MLATVTDWLWSYVLIAALLLVGFRLTWDARFVQLRLFKEMFRGLSGGFSGTDKGLSSFQALVVSVAGRSGLMLTDSMLSSAFALLLILIGGRSSSSCASVGG